MNKDHGMNFHLHLLILPLTSYLLLLTSYLLLLTSYFLSITSYLFTYFPIKNMVFIPKEVNFDSYSVIMFSEKSELWRS